MTTVAPAYLTLFGTATIPGARGRFQWPAAARPSTVPTINGSFDAAGISRADVQLPYTLTYTGAAVHATDTTQVLTQLDALRAVSGTYDKLTMAMADGTTRWAYARLVNVSPEMVATDRAVITFNMVFQVATVWNGVAHGADTDPAIPVLFANGLLADNNNMILMTASPMTVVLWNGGTVPVHDCGISIFCGAANITYFKIGIASVCEYEFTGTVIDGTRMVIDCGARTIVNDGADAFKDWSRTQNHLTDKWFTLAPGNNTVTFTYTKAGGGDTWVLWTYSEGWA